MMPGRATGPASPGRRAGIVAAATILFFAGFFANFWRAAEQPWFDTHLRSDVYVIGRMMQAREVGLFSEGGLLGRTRPGLALMPDRQLAEYQLNAYLADQSFAVFEPYKSQVGLQGLVFGALDLLLPIATPTRYLLFQAVTALLSALALALITVWFWLEFGTVVGLAVALSIMLSPWLTLFGRNLFWATWAFYVPMIAVMFWLRQSSTAGRQHLRQYGAVVFGAVLVKCLFNGYEFITTALVMLVVPLAYYAVLRTWSLRQLLIGLIITGFAAGLAVLLTFAVLSIQIAAAEGSLAAGLQHIVISFEKRSYADPAAFPDQAASLQAGLGWVLAGYLQGTYIDLNYWLAAPSRFVSQQVLQIKYYSLVALVALGTVLVWVQARRRAASAAGSRRGLGLVAAAWVALAAPLSWYVVFKAHAAAHGHIDYIIWQMPFTMFAVALGAYVLVQAFNAIRARLAASRASSLAAGGTPEV